MDIPSQSVSPPVNQPFIPVVLGMVVSSATRMDAAVVAVSIALGSTSLTESWKAFIAPPNLGSPSDILSQSVSPPVNRPLNPKVLGIFSSRANSMSAAAEADSSLLDSIIYVAVWKSCIAFPNLGRPSVIPSQSVFPPVKRPLNPRVLGIFSSNVNSISAAAAALAIFSEFMANVAVWNFCIASPKETKPSPNPSQSDLPPVNRPLNPKVLGIFSSNVNSISAAA